MQKNVACRTQKNAVPNPGIYLYAPYENQKHTVIEKNISVFFMQMSKAQENRIFCSVVSFNIRTLDSILCTLFEKRNLSLRTHSHLYLYSYSSYKAGRATLFWRISLHVTDNDIMPVCDENFSQIA